MKFKKLIVVVMSVLPVIGFAKDLSIVLEGGATFRGLKADNLSEYVQYIEDYYELVESTAVSSQALAGVGFTIGAKVDVPVNDLISIQSGLYYKRSKAQVLTNFTYYTDKFYDYYSFDYMELPLLIKFTFKDIGIYGGAGAQYLLKGATGFEARDSNYTNSETAIDSELLNSFTYSYILGVDINFEFIDPIFVLFDCNYNRQLSSFLSDDLYFTPTLHGLDFSIGIGISL